MSADLLTLAEAGRIMREAVRDKSYQLTPLGQEAAGYLRVKRKRLTASSYRDYESGLDKLARYFPDLELDDFEPPVGTERLEEFLDALWGDREPRTYNKNLSIVGDFFDWQVRRGRMHGDPTTPIERAKSRQVLREVFSTDDRRAIISGQPDLRDRIALRLLLDYGLRKGALRAVQFKHFDHYRKRLTVFSKGGTVRELPIPDPAFWFDLERHIQDVGAVSAHYLLARQKMIPRAGLRRFPDDPMGAHGLHSWWYRCLVTAGVVAEGTTKGERMHKARHTAGQRVLDATGNLKAVQKLLGHSSIQTTGDVYADWDIEALARTMAQVLEMAGLWRRWESNPRGVPAVRCSLDPLVAGLVDVPHRFGRVTDGPDQLAVALGAVDSLHSLVGLVRRSTACALLVADLVSAARAGGRLHASILRESA